MTAGRGPQLDPITFELVHAALLSAAEEMGAVLKRSSYSPIIREMEDFSCALFDADGTLVVQADYIPAQLGAMSLVVESTLARWGRAVEPGDVFIANHPYMGCMHTPDLNVLMPVFIDGRLFAWAGTTAHHIDVGGVNPGTEGPSLRSVYAEGLLFPPTRLYRAHEENRDVFDLIATNVRDPFATLGDLRAQHAACLLGERRLRELVDKHGARTVRRAFVEALDRVERATRLALAALPDGTGEAEGHLDDDALGGPPVRIHARLAKDADRLLVDLSGTATDRRGAERSVGEHPGHRDVPGSRDHGSRHRHEGRDPAAPRDRLPARDHPEPRAASGRVRASQYVSATDRRPARSGVEDLAGEGGREQHGHVRRDERRGDLAEDRAPGHHDRCCRRGDRRAPLGRQTRWGGHLPGQCGPPPGGRWPRPSTPSGSSGASYVATTGSSAYTATAYCEQTDPRFAPRGVLGGTDGAPTLTILGPDGRVIPTTSKVTMVLEPGSVIRLETSGGGGYGAPGRRDPSAEHADRADGRFGRRRGRARAAPPRRAVPAPKAD